MENTSIKKEDNSTTENNCLIAEFMGEPTSFIHDTGSQVVELKMSHNYHEWNKLMPVVEKIKLQWQNHKVKDVRQDIELIRKYNIVLSMLICDQISEVYENIVEFIKWYTQHENKKV